MDSYVLFGDLVREAISGPLDFYGNLMKIDQMHGDVNFKVSLVSGLSKYAPKIHEYQIHQLKSLDNEARREINEEIADFIGIFMNAHEMLKIFANEHSEEVLEFDRFEEVLTDFSAEESSQEKLLQALVFFISNIHFLEMDSLEDLETWDKTLLKDDLLEHVSTVIPAEAYYELLGNSEDD